MTARRSQASPPAIALASAYFLIRDGPREGWLWAIPDTYHAPANAAHVFDRSLLHPLPQPAESRSSETPSLLLVCVSFTSILDQGATEHIRVPRINTYVNRPVLSHIVPADYIFRSCHFPQIWSSLTLWPHMRLLPIGGSSTTSPVSVAILTVFFSRAQLVIM